MLAVNPNPTVLRRAKLASFWEKIYVNLMSVKNHFLCPLITSSWENNFIKTKRIYSDRLVWTSDG